MRGGKVTLLTAALVFLLRGLLSPLMFSLKRPRSATRSLSGRTENMRISGIPGGQVSVSHSKIKRKSRPQPGVTAVTGRQGALLSLMIVFSLRGGYASSLERRRRHPKMFKSSVDKSYLTLAVIILACGSALMSSDGWTKVLINKSKQQERGAGENQASQTAVRRPG